MHQVLSQKIKQCQEQLSRAQSLLDQAPDLLAPEAFPVLDALLQARDGFQSVNNIREALVNARRAAGLR